MKVNKYKHVVEQMLIKAGVKINGPESFDILVKNEDFYKRVLAKGSLGLGESYMDGWWDCEKLDEFIFKILRANLYKQVSFNWTTIKTVLRSKLFNRQSLIGAKEVAEKHYDLSHELYESFLDPYNQYTCGYFKGTNDLNKAQEQKLQLICEKLQLKSADKVLDIGCGWGGFAKFASLNFGCHVTGITISKQQAAYAREFAKGLSVDIQEVDYRELSGLYDKILVCGMIEHVGYKNYKKFFQIVHDHLTKDGLFLLHTVGSNKSVINGDPWLTKYIFPNGMLPSVKQLAGTTESLFILEDLHNFGAHYHNTLMAWHENFIKNWPSLKKDYDERFYRMWRYYLQSFAGFLKARKAQLWQMVFSKEGVLGGYKSIR